MTPPAVGTQERFANLIMLFYTGVAGYNQPNLCRRPYIDEEAMITFFQQCYATKYAKTVRDMYDVQRFTTDQLRTYTRTFAHNCKRKKDEPDEKWEKRLLQAKKKAMPQDTILRRYARLALLNWSYWLNGYRPGGDAFCNPLELYEGLPYYGFIPDPRNPEHYVLSPVVSPPKPVPDSVLPSMNLHRRPDAEEAANEARAQEEARIQREAQEETERREQQRLERQRQAAERQKRMAEEDVERVPAAAPNSRPNKKAALGERRQPAPLHAAKPPAPLHAAKPPAAAAQVSIERRAQPAPLRTKTPIPPLLAPGVKVPSTAVVIAPPPSAPRSAIARPAVQRQLSHTAQLK